MSALQARAKGQECGQGAGWAGGAGQGTWASPGGLGHSGEGPGCPAQPPRDPASGQACRAGSVICLVDTVCGPSGCWPEAPPASHVLSTCGGGAGSCQREPRVNAVWENAKPGATHTGRALSRSESRSGLAPPLGHATRADAGPPAPAAA